MSNSCTMLFFFVFCFWFSYKNLFLRIKELNERSEKGNQYQHSSQVFSLNDINQNKENKDQLQNILGSRYFFWFISINLTSYHLPIKYKLIDTRENSLSLKHFIRMENTISKIKKIIKLNLAQTTVIFTKKVLKNSFWFIGIIYVNIILWRKTYIKVKTYILHYQSWIRKKNVLSC